MKSIAYALTLLVTLSLSIFSVKAGIIPTHPSGATVVHPGDEMTILWKENGNVPLLKDLGKVVVKFMTGGDLEQKELKVINTVNALDLSLKWVIPVVEPAGKIYFIRFEAGDQLFFTTRFTITDTNGKFPPPPNPPPPVGQNKGGDGRIVGDGNTTGGGNTGGNSTTGGGNTGGNSTTGGGTGTGTGSGSGTSGPANSTVSATVNSVETNPSNTSSSTNGNTQGLSSMSTRTVASNGLGFGAVIGGMTVTILAFGGVFI